MSTTQSPIESLLKLERHVERWNKEFSSGTGRGTLLEGIAGKAVNSFENLLRDCLVFFLGICSLSYEKEAAANFDEKPLHLLTMGEVVQTFEKLDRKLTTCVRSMSVAHLVATRRLVGQDQKRVLNEITKLRNLLHHHRATFSRDEDTLEENTKQLLKLIEEALSGRIFEIIRNLNATS
jgi:hypothetical protein